MGSFVLLTAATAAFVAAFHTVDIKHTDKPSSQTVQSTASSAAASAVSSGLGSGDASSAVQAVAQFQQPDDWRLVLVNFDHKMPDDYQHTIVHEMGIDIDSRIIKPYQQMRDAAKKDGITLWISSAYRSPEKQGTLFEQEIKNYSKTGLSEVEALAKAESSVARPGYSEHNTGLAIDLNGVSESFGGTPASNWLVEHAPEYGFILRYPEDKQSITKIKYEAWHYRYVGVENAEKIKEKNMCLEEYVDYLQKNQSSGN